MAGGGTKRREVRKRAAAVALVALLHAGLLLWAGLSRPTLRFEGLMETPAQIFLVPRIVSTPESQPHVAKSPSATASAILSAPARPVATIPLKPHLAPPPSAVGAPSPLALPSIPGSGAGVVGQGATADTSGGGVSGLLRGSVGCDHKDFVRLSEDERDRCNQRFGAEARKSGGPVDTVPPAKRAYYDAVQREYEMMRHYGTPTPLRARGSLGIAEDDSVLINGEMGGHPGGVGCGLSFGKGGGKKGESFSDTVKRTGEIGATIGPIHCGVRLPQGSLTPEVGIPPP